MAKAVIKEGYSNFTTYFKQEYLEEIRRRAKKEDRTITYIVNELIMLGLQQKEREHAI